LRVGFPQQPRFGVTGSGKTFAIAHVIAAVQRPTDVLVPNKTIAAQRYGEIKQAAAVSAAHRSLL